MDVPAERRRLRRHARRIASRLLLRRRVVDVRLPRSRADDRRRARAARAKVDCVFAINDALADAKRAVNPRHVRVAARRRSRAVRARARRDDARCPADLAALPRPRIGFYGTLRDWVDFELIAHVARARPDVVDRADRPAARRRRRVRGLPNVHLLGRNAARRAARVLQGLRRRHHPVSHRRAHDVRQPAQAARVPVGGRAGRVDAGARGACATPRIARIARYARRVRRGDRARARRATRRPRAPRARRR